MDGSKRSKTEYVDKTILNTPKPTASWLTDNKKSFQKESISEVKGLENSLDVINIDEMQNSSKSQFHTSNASDLSFQLKQQHQLANSSLQRENKVAALPSKYLRPNVSNSSFSSLSITNGSTINESDLTKSDTLADLEMATSPVPLIDSSITFTEEQNNDKAKNKKGLSIFTIEKLLAETDNTPRKMTSYLLKLGQKLSGNSTDQESLPVSKNSSYTSDYSDNNTMRQLVALSEGSTRSLSSALTSSPNGKLPIESTNTELIWGCVKVDKSATQEFLLRNKTSKRLCFQMSIAGYDFKIRKDNRQESEPLSSAKILLHPHESRPVIVSFIPTKIGAAVDELNFTSLDPNLEQTKKQCVKLFGYGGFGKIDIPNLTKDITGKFWLGLGKLDNQNVLTHKFFVKSKGTLPCFVCVTFNPKQVFAFANVSVAPSCCVLIPNEQKEITVTYVLSMEDRQVLLNTLFPNSMVAEIGNLLVISGTEVNRGRLRRQCRKCAEKGLEIDPISSMLKEKVKGEIMPSDINLFKEAPGSLREILKLFVQNEVVMTIEHDPELTMIPQYPDESVMFHTLCQDNTTMNLETTNLQASCKLEPSSIILTPPMKTRDSLFLTSEGKKTLNFEVVCNPDGLEVFPTDGIIAPGQQTVINLSCPKYFLRSAREFKVLVYVENEVFEATVKIIFVRSQKKSRFF